MGENKKILESFVKTEGKQIMNRLKGVSKQKADKFDPLTDEEEAELENRLNGEVKNVGQYVESKFETQEEKHVDNLKKENEEYQKDFNKLSKAIRDKENELSELVKQFNESDDPDQKNHIYSQIVIEMREIRRISENFGASVKNTDVDEVVEALRYYDEVYDEEVVRKVIKSLEDDKVS